MSVSSACFCVDSKPTGPSCAGRFRGVAGILSVVVGSETGGERGGWRLPSGVKTRVMGVGGVTGSWWWWWVMETG
jgi:hypothetical protein